MKKYLTKRNLIIAGGVIILALVLFFVFKNGNGKQTVKIIQADIIQEVAVTGKVKPNQNVNLGFDKTGRVAGVYVSVGEVVKKGQITTSLEAEETSADLAKARALLLEENIKLREIKSTTPVSYNDASKNLVAAINEGFADADNAVRNRADQFFKNVPDNPNFEISITSGNFIHYFNVSTDLVLDINNRRKDAEIILDDWQKRISNLNSTNLVSEADKAINNLNAISTFLDKMANAVNSFTSVDYTYDTSVSNYKVAISTARNDVSGAVSAIVTAKDKFNSAPTLSEGGQFENISAQEAKVAQARAAVASLEASLGKSSIIAPFDGVITLQEAKVGSAVSPGGTLVSIISQNQMYVEANISEIHIGKVAAGNLAVITLDAFPGEEFLGEINYVEPGDVVVDGVVNYKIRVNFKNFDPKIKSGLTANLKIQTAKKENVLAVPLYAITKEGDKNFVNKIIGDEIQKTQIDLGISGNNGFAEVVGGLQEGDIIEF